MLALLQEHAILRSLIGFHMTESLLNLLFAQFWGFCLGILVFYWTMRPKLKSDIKVSSLRAGKDHIHLSWQDIWPVRSFGSIEYIILRKDGLLNPWREIAVTRKMCIVDADVVPGKRYRYKICGTRAAVKGNSFRASESLKVVA